MKKVLGGILLVVYSIIAITVTVLLLSYNEYNCSQIGGYTVFIVNDDSLEPDYKQGSILLIRETSDKNVKIGDEMFLYKVINSQEYELVNRTLTDKLQQGNHITYVVTNTEEENEKNEENYANDYFIGKASDTVVIEGWGYVLGLLESKWGYLFCVVIVSLLLFLQEVFELAMEIKYGKADREAEEAAERTKRAERTKKSQGTKSAKTATRTTSSATKTAATRTTSGAAKTAATRTTSGTTKTGTTRKTSSVSKTSTTGATKTASTAKKASTAKATSSTTKKSTSNATAIKDKNESNDEEE